jgi:hypothetical protein
MGTARQADAPGFEPFADDVGRGLAFRGEIGGQDHLLHLTIAGTLKQFFQPNVLGANAVEGADLAHENKVQPFVGAGTLNGRLVGRRFNHAQLAHVAPRIQASGAHLILREGVATIAVAHLLGRFMERTGKRLGTGAVMLHQMKSHA